MAVIEVGRLDLDAVGAGGREQQLGAHHLAVRLRIIAARPPVPDQPVAARQFARDAERQHILDDRSAHRRREARSDEHTSELQSLMRLSYAVFCLKKKILLPTQM